MEPAVAMSWVVEGVRKHTVWNTCCTLHAANCWLPAISWPQDLAPLPLPGSEELQPNTALGPARQRFSQLSSGVTKPCGKFRVLMWYFACVVPAVYTSWFWVVS